MIRVVLEIEDTHIEAIRDEGVWKGKAKDGISGKETLFNASDSQMAAISALAIDGDPQDAAMMAINDDLRLIAAPIMDVFPPEICIVP